MNVTKVCLGGLVATLLSLGQAKAQSQSYDSMSGSPSGVIPSPSSTSATGEPNPHETAPAGTPLPPPNLSLSSWMLYQHPTGCCGPIGGNGPIVGEIYARTGVAFPIGGGFLNNVLSPGWEVEGGVRTLFFNPALDSAWVVDVGITNIYNNASDKTSKVNLLNVSSTVNSTTTLIPSVPVSVGSVNRTFFNLGGGKEWYLMGAAEQHERTANLRIGVDGGGRWGSEKIDLNELTHRTDMIGGVYVAAHTDYEVPFGACIFSAGLRLEYAYTWSDILQHQNITDQQDLSVLLTAGVRF